MFRKVRKAMAYFVFSLAYVLIFLGYKISQRKNEKDIVAFASDFFTGNIKYLYQEMKNHADLKLYFVTGNKNELDRLKSFKMETYYYMDINCIPLFLKTKIWVTSHGPANIPFIGAMHTISARLNTRRLRILLRYFLSYWTKTRNSKWVDVWHAVEVKFVGRPRMLVDYDLGFVTSEFYKEYYSKRAPISDKLKITGIPRTDPLIKKDVDKNEIIKSLHIPPNRKNVLYAPTHGHGKKRPFFPWARFDEIVREIEKFCEKRNCNFLVRMHVLWGNQEIELEEKLEKNWKLGKNIFHLPFHKFPDTQPLLYVSDVLITDWSSIASEFVLLRRPILFLDSESPAEELVLKPEERVGYIVKGEREFFEKLEEALVRPNLFEEKRQMLIEKLYKHLDGNSSKRCAEEIIKLLKA